jgi:hypothetical protein
VQKELKKDEQAGKLMDRHFDRYSNGLGGTVTLVRD